MEGKPFGMVDMTRIETQHKQSRSSAEQLFDFLSDMNNYELLMPDGKIEKWQSEKDRCEFTIKGMARIGMQIVESSRPQSIEIESFGKVPFPFKLNIHIHPTNDQSAELFMVFDGEINAFMKMMVEKPLRNFFDMLVEKAADLNL